MAGRWVAAVAVALVSVGCGARATEVEAAQSGPEPSAPVAPDPGGGSTTVPGAPGTEPATSPSTTLVVAPDRDPGASPVDGLDALELQEALTAPPTERGRGATGPVAEAVSLADGRTVWRVRIPGGFPARDARATISVGGRDVGVAASPPSLDALATVTTTPEGLVDGAPVTYRWGADDPTDAGPLVVLR